MRVIPLIFAVILVSLLGTVKPAVSQRKAVERTFGLSASIQGEQLDVMLPIWAGNKAVIAPAFSVVYVEDVGVDIGIGIAPRFYLRMDSVAPYIGGRVAVFMNSPSGRSTQETTDWLAGFAFGGEFYLNPRFGIGIEAQANFTISDRSSGRFGNPDGMSLNTATAVFASVYF